jgi:hypothetical protein
MADIICRYCGEPWEYYTLKHDLKQGEAVLNGDGCPACDWGEKQEPTYEDEWMFSLDKNTDEDPFKYI